MYTSAVWRARPRFHALGIASPPPAGSTTKRFPSGGTVIIKKVFQLTAINSYWRPPGNRFDKPLPSKLAH